jgi:hypothetical protein
MILDQEQSQFTLEIECRLENEFMENGRIGSSVLAPLVVPYTSWNDH